MRISGCQYKTYTKRREVLRMQISGRQYKTYTKRREVLRIQILSVRRQVTIIFSIT